MKLQEYAFERIREKRKRLKWSQTKLAQKAGIQRVSLSQLETGKFSPNTATILKVAAALNVSVGYFFRRKY